MKTAILAMLLLVSQVLSANAAEYLVKYKSTNALNNLTRTATMANSGMQVMDHHAPGSYIKVSIDKKVEAKTLASLLSNPGVEYVVPNFKLHSFYAPVTATALKEQWAIAKVNAEKAWQRAGNKGSRNVLLAVIDTGVDYNHQNLAANAVQGHDFKNNTDDPMDKTGSQNPGHGTHCAGIIGATGLVDGGTIGISPELSIMPLRFLDENGSGDLNDGIKAIDYAIEKHVQIISASWGATVSRSQAQPLIDAIKRADDKGIIFIAAAANDGKNNDKTEVYPANSGLPNTITVAASGSGDAKPSWSNYGTATVHLAAPGENIMSTLPGNKYGNLSGTSMATPLVAGMVAFLKAQDPSLTGAQVRALLQSSGAKVSIETACNCRVDALAAVDTLLSKKLWMVPAAATLAKGDTLNLQVMNANGAVAYTSSNPAVISVSASGQVRAEADGVATISAKDSKGTSVSSLDYHVGKVAGGNPPPDDGGGGGGGGGDGQCPVGDPALCQIICAIQPDLPFCQK